MKRILNNKNFLFKIQKRFEKTEKKRIRRGGLDGELARYQVDKHPAQDKWPLYRDHPTANIMEKIAYFAKGTKEKVNLETNTMHHFIQTHTKEEIQKMDMEEIYQEVDPDDICTLIHSLPEDVQESLLVSFQQEVVPLINKLQINSEQIDTFQFKNYLWNAPEGLEEVLDASAEERDQVLEFIDDHEELPQHVNFPLLPKELRQEVKEYLKIKRDIQCEEIGMKILENEGEKDEEEEEEGKSKGLDDKKEEYLDDEVRKDIRVQKHPAIFKALILKEIEEHEIESDEIDDEEPLNNDKTINNNTLLGNKITEEQKKYLLDWAESEECKKLFELAEQNVIDAVSRARSIYDDDYVKDTPKPDVDELTDVASPHTGDKMWQLHKMDPRLWTGDRLGGLFGVSRERAWGEIMVREYHEATETGKPFNFDKVSLIFKDAFKKTHTTDHNRFSFKTKYINEEEAYQDYLKAIKSPPVEGGDDLLPDWAALPFQPYRTMETEPEIKILPDVKPFEGYGAIGTNTRILYVDYGRGINHQNRKYVVRDVDGTLRTATWAEEKHYFRIGTTMKKLLNGRGNRHKKRLVKRRRLFDKTFE